MSKLKSCPFCSGEDAEVRTDDNGISWYIFCNDCGVSCGYSMKREDAVRAWNTRTEPWK